MSKEEFLKELKENFAQNGNWFNYTTPEGECNTPFGTIKVYHTIGFKVTDKMVYFCFKDYVDGQSGCFALRGRFNIDLLSENKDVNELIKNIFEENGCVMNVPRFE